MDKTSNSLQQKAKWVVPELTRMSVEETLGGIILNHSESADFQIIGGKIPSGHES